MNQRLGWPVEDQLVGRKQVPPELAAMVEGGGLPKTKVERGLRRCSDAISATMRLVSDQRVLPPFARPPDGEAGCDASAVVDQSEPVSS